MMPYQTFEQRKARVEAFISAYQSKTAIVKTFASLAKHLEISPMRMIPPYQTYFNRFQDTGNVGPMRVPNPTPVTEEEAKAYFDYLIGVVLGTQNPPKESKDRSGRFEYTGDWTKTAYDQLDEMIFAMTPDLEYSQDIYAGTDWQKKFDAIEKELASMRDDINSRDLKIIEVLTEIRNWIATYRQDLEDARTYFGNRRSSGGGRNVGQNP